MKALRAEKYPELQLTQMGIKHSNQFANAPLLIMARQRQFMKPVMAELLQRCNSSSTTIEAAGRKTTQRYCTNSWHKKAQGLFFYFHAQLGNFNQELTCLVFGFNTYTLNDGPNYGNFYQNFKQEVRFILTGNFYFDLKFVLRYAAMNSNKTSNQKKSG
jgi:hypothetical protein